MVVRGVEVVGTDAKVGHVGRKEEIGCAVVVMVREMGAVTKTVVMMHCVV